MFLFSIFYHTIFLAFIRRSGNIGANTRMDVIGRGSQTIKMFQKQFIPISFPFLEEYLAIAFWLKKSV